MALELQLLRLLSFMLIRLENRRSRQVLDARGLMTQHNQAFRT